MSHRPPKFSKKNKALQYLKEKTSFPFPYISIYEINNQIAIVSLHLQKWKNTHTFQPEQWHTSFPKRCSDTRRPQKLTKEYFAKATNDHEGSAGTLCKHNFGSCQMYSCDRNESEQAIIDRSVLASSSSDGRVSCPLIEHFADQVQ